MIWNDVVPSRSTAETVIWPASRLYLLAMLLIKPLERRKKSPQDVSEGDWLPVRLPFKCKNEFGIIEEIRVNIEVIHEPVHFVDADDFAEVYIQITYAITRAWNSLFNDG
jgi:hypothetical protein